MQPDTASAPEKVWRQLDADHDGHITLDEFVDSILRKQYITCGERASHSHSTQDNLARIRQQSRGWQPAPRETVVMAVEARAVGRAASPQGLPTVSPRFFSPHCDARGLR